MNEPPKAIDNTAQFGQHGIMRLMLRYSFPSIVAMLVSASYNIINMTFIGRSVGPLGIAAIAVAFPILLIQGAITQLVSNGCAAAIAIKLGAGDKEEPQVMLGSSFALVLILSAMSMIVCGLFLSPLLRAFGASEAVLPYAREYFGIIILTIPFGGITTMNPMLRIEGYPKRAMATMLIGSGVNLICSPVLIFVFGLGIRGAALSICGAQIASAVWTFSFMAGRKRVVGLKLRYIRLRIRTLLRVVQLGLPTFFMQLAENLLSVVLNRSLGTYGGDIAISSWGVTNSINSLVVQPVYGLNQGVQPIIGYNIGAKEYARVRKALLYSLLAATVFSSFGWLLIRLFPAQIIAFFNNDPDLIAAGSRMLIVFRALIFLVGFQQAGAAYFQFAGKPKTSIFLSLSRQVMILIPCILILPRFFQMNGILYSGPIADSISAVLTAIFVLFELKRLRKLAREETS